MVFPGVGSAAGRSPYAHGATPAANAHRAEGSAHATPTAPPCGYQVTSSIVLTADVGPCTTDGLDIVADGVTVYLNGHKIVGSDQTNTSTSSEQVGVNFMNVHNSALVGPGTITHFDAGVAVNGGGQNTVKGVTAMSNIAHVLLNNGTTPTNPEAYPCNYGDGILTDNSNGNLITDNYATNNGPFDGIALVDSSNHNTVSHNQSIDNNFSNIEPNGTTSGPCGPFGAASVGPGRAHQDIGIRIEGPGASYNTLADNQSIGNQLEGISIHDYVCPGAFGPTFPGTPPNQYNTVEDNFVESNGFIDNTDGISILVQGPAGTVCVPSYNTIIGNTSIRNSHDGIQMGGRGSHNNVVEHNTVYQNGNDGIEVGGPTAPSTRLPNGLPGSIDNTITHNTGYQNLNYDGADDNPNCDNNLWAHNHFGTVNQACVAAQSS